MTETNKMLEECANYLLNHCFVLGTVTTVNGGTVSLKDWIESGNSQIYNTFTEELAKRNIKLEFNLVEEDQYTTVCQTTF